MVVLINTFQMRYFGYLYILSMVQKLDFSRPRFDDIQWLGNLLFSAYFSSQPSVRRQREEEVWRGGFLTREFIWNIHISSSVKRYGQQQQQFKQT